METFTRIPREIEDLLDTLSGTTSRRQFLKGSGLFVVSLSGAGQAGALLSGEALDAQASLYPDPDFL